MEMPLIFVSAAAAGRPLRRNRTCVKRDGYSMADRASKEALILKHAPGDIRTRPNKAFAFEERPPPTPLAKLRTQEDELLQRDFRAESQEFSSPVSNSACTQKPVCTCMVSPSLHCYVILSLRPAGDYERSARVSFLALSALLHSRSRTPDRSL